MNVPAPTSRLSRLPEAGSRRSDLGPFYRTFALLFALSLSPANLLATPLDLEAELRGLGAPRGASAAEVSAITAALRAGDFQLAEARARALRDATPGLADHELLLALARLGGERFVALQVQIAALDNSSQDSADRIRMVVARHLLSRGRSYLAQYFLSSARTADGERERLRVDAQLFSAARRIEAAKAAQLGVLKNDRDNAEALLNMARLHLLDNTPSRALGYLQRIAVLQGEAGTTAAGVGRRLLEANAYMLLGDLQQAEGAFTTLRGGPVATPATFNLALINNLRGDYEASRRGFESLPLVEGAPLDPLPGLILAQLGAGDADAAHKSLLKAARGRGDPLDALLGAAIASAQGDWPRASAALRDGARLFIDMALPGFEARDYLGAEPAAAAFDLARRNYLYRLGYFRLAAAGEVPGGGQPPAPAFSLLSKARSAWKAGRSEEALELYDAVRLAHPQLVTPLVESADIHFFNGDAERAIRLYRQAVKAQPQLTVLQLQLGDLLSTAGQATAALKIYAAINQREANNAQAAARSASVLFEQQDNPQAALAHAERAHRDGAGNAQFTALLGRIHHALGDSNKALELLRLALNESGGRDPAIFARIGEVLQTLNERDKAIRAYEHALNSAQDFEQRAAAEQAFLQLLGLPARS